MVSTRLTNALLAIIAACLLVIVAKDVVPAVVPAAFAQMGTLKASPVEARLHGRHCTPGGASGPTCLWVPVSIEKGSIATYTPPK